MVVLRVERSLEARAERNRGRTGTSSASGVVGTASHAQPSARAADHTANTNVSMLQLSRYTPTVTSACSPQTLA